jgi:hypothetical protein
MQSSSNQGRGEASPFSLFQGRRQGFNPALPFFFMSKILEFPRKPGLVGRLLALNIEKATKFQCRGFSVGPRNPSAVVGEEASVAALEQALAAGVLIDITDNKEVHTDLTGMSAVDEQQTEKRLYSNKRGFFLRLGIGEEGDEDETVLYGTSDPEEQESIEAALRVSGIMLAPGMDDPEKYLLKL